MLMELVEIVIRRVLASSLLDLSYCRTFVDFGPSCLLLCRLAPLRTHTAPPERAADSEVCARCVVDGVRAI